MFGVAFPGSAEWVTGNETAGSSWGLGAGVYSEQKAYIDVDRKNRVVPILTFENQYIRLTGPELAFKLPSYELS
ncbi:hypothetical protein R0K04_27880, partial [Pseudoalteromonas sp. SIMBA_153]